MSVQYEMFIHLLDTMPLPIRLCDRSARTVHDTPLLHTALAGPDTTRLASAMTELARRVALERPAEPIQSSTQVGSSAYRLCGTAVSATVAGHDSIVVALNRETRATPSDSELRARFRLTPREIDIVRMLVTGLPNDEIAAKLARSRYTVRRHTESILSKLDVRRRAQVGARLAEM